MAIKTEAQQAVLAMPSDQAGAGEDAYGTNERRTGVLAEYGKVFGTSRKSFNAGINAPLEWLDERPLMLLIEPLYYQFKRAGQAG